MGKNTTYENLWDLPKALLWVKSIVLHACVRKDQMSQIIKLLTLQTRKSR